MAENPAVPAAPSAYYPALDGLRAAAIVLVFALHFDGDSAIGQWGWTGVDLFFVLSGFLITGILYDSRKRTHAFRDFYYRRTLRIFPLYFLIWGGILLTQPLLHWVWPRYSFLWPLYLGNFAMMIPPTGGHPVDTFFFQIHGRPTIPLQVGHFWSLCIEEQFYLLWPLIVLRSRSRATVLKAILAVLAAVSLIRVAVLFTTSADLRHAIPILYLNTFTRVDALIWGALLAMLIRGNAQTLHRYGRIILASTAAVLIAFLTMRSLQAPVGLAGRNTSDLNMVLGLPIIDAFGFALVLELIRAGSPFAKLFTWKPARRLGQISYGFYVFHSLLGRVYPVLARHLVPGRYLQNQQLVLWTTMVVAFAGTWLIAEICYRVYETPFIRLKNRFPGQTHTAPAS